MNFSELAPQQKQPWTSPMALSSKQSLSGASSSRSSSKYSEKSSEAPSSRSTMVKAKSKLSRRPAGSESLPGSAEDFEKQKSKEVEKARRQVEYERLKLREQTIFGMRGAGGFGPA